MGDFLGYRCSICKAEYPPTQVMYTCPLEGGNLDVVLDIKQLKQKYHVSDITSRKEKKIFLRAVIA